MSTFWFALAALAVVPNASSTPAGVSASPGLVQQELLVPSRTGRKLQDAVRAAMRRWARPQDNEVEPAAWEFLLLYDELQADRELARGQRQELLAVVRSRLSKLAERTKKRDSGPGARGSKPLLPVPNPGPVIPGPESVAAAVGGQNVLAQMGPWGPPGGRAGRGFGLPGFGAPGFGAAGWGGGLMGGGPFGGPGPQSDDYGPQLVDLIQQVIAPQSWDVNGGLGTAYYWRPGRALVIRQTGGVHDQLTDLLEQLGRAGR